MSLALGLAVGGTSGVSSLRWSLVAARHSHLASIAALEAAEYPLDEACSPENFAYRLDHAGGYFKTAVSSTAGDQVLGFVVGTLSASSVLSHESMFKHDPQGTALCIHSLCVSGLLQRQGVGRAMLVEYVRSIRREQPQVQTILLICKKNLIGFYQSCGFTLIGPSDVVHGVEPWFECRLDLHPAAATAAAASSHSPAALSTIPIWLDCDPGHDDALAIILAGWSPRLRLLGISTVAGNQSIEKTTLNARNVLNITGLSHVPVFEGRDDPIKRPAMRCPEIHGSNGLEGSHFPPLAPLAASHHKAFEAIAAMLRSSPEPVTLVATGPLTNIALLVLSHPELLTDRYIKQIVLMGGAIGLGNTSPAAEFNIEVDAEAAAIVFDCGRPVVMVPLEVTHTALVTESVLNRVLSVGSGGKGPSHGSPFAGFIGDLLLFFRDAYREVFGFEAPPLHDPCAVAYLLAPELFTTQLMRVDVECTSELTYGRTVCDVHKRDKRTPPKPLNVRVATAMQVTPFWELMLAALDQADRHSCLNRAQGEQRYHPTHAAAAAAEVEAETEAAALATAAARGRRRSSVPSAALVQLESIPLFHGGL